MAGEGDEAGLLVIDDDARQVVDLPGGEGGDGPPLGREHERAGLLSAIEHAGIRSAVWPTADVHYTAAHRYDPARVRFTDFHPCREFVGGPLHAGAFGPHVPDDTFGPEVVRQKAPEPGRENLSPAEGMRFFGEVAIEGRTGAMTVAPRDVSGAALWQRGFEPERARWAGHAPGVSGLPRPGAAAPTKPVATRGRAMAMRSSPSSMYQRV